MFFRKTRKMQKQIDEIYSLIKTKEYTQLKKDSLELQEINQLLSHIKFKVKNVRVFEDVHNDAQIVKIFYEQPVITLHLENDGELELNETFYAINRLDLSELEDLEKINGVLRTLKKEEK